MDLFVQSPMKSLSGAQPKTGPVKSYISWRIGEEINSWPPGWGSLFQNVMNVKNVVWIFTNIKLFFLIQKKYYYFMYKFLQCACSKAMKSRSRPRLISAGNMLGLEEYIPYSSELKKKGKYLAIFKRIIVVFITVHLFRSVRPPSGCGKKGVFINEELLIDIAVPRCLCQHGWWFMMH